MKQIYKTIRFLSRELPVVLESGAGKLCIRKLLVLLPRKILKAPALHLVYLVLVRVESVCRHVTAFSTFLPTNRRDIFPATEEGFEEGNMRFGGVHIGLLCD